MTSELAGKLAATRSRIRLIQLASGLAASSAATLAVFVATFHVDRALALTSAGRLGWLAALALVALGALGLWVVRPLRRPLTDADVALVVERRHPELAERLLTTVELAGAGATAGTSRSLAAIVAHEASRIAAPLDFAAAAPAGPLRRPSLALLLAIALALAHVALWPGGLSNWLQRLLFPFADIPVYAATRVWVTPGDAVVPRRADVTLGVRTEGKPAQRARLFYRFDGDRWAEAILADPQPGSAHGSSTFRLALTDVQRSLNYYATANDGRANPHRIVVENRPTFLSYSIRLQYPAYTHRPAETLAATTANIVALPGTRVDIEARANKPLKEVVERDGPRVIGRWKVSGDTAADRLVVDADLDHALDLVDQRGFEAVPPPRLSIRTQRDQTPVVQVVKPNADLERTPNASFDLQVRATDDYGVESMRMEYRIGKRSGSVELPFAANSTPVAAAAAARIRLAGLGLKGGDTLVYQATARDGDTVSGPHVGRSASYQVKILDEKELRERLTGESLEEQEAVRRLARREQQLRSEAAKARPDQADVLRRVAAAQRAMAAEARDIAARIAATTQKTAENELSPASELAERRDAERTMQRLAASDMPRAADTLQRAADRSSAPDRAAAAALQDQIRQDLQRVATQIGPPPNSAQLAQEAQQLADAQQRLADASRVAAEPLDGRSESQLTSHERETLNALAQRQAELRHRTADLQAEMQKAAQQSADQDPAETRTLKQAANLARSQQPTVQQQSAQTALKAGRPLDAGQRQDQAAETLRQIAQTLNGASTTAPDSRRADQLDQAADRLVQMADTQRQAVDAMRRNPDASAAQRIAGTENDLRRQLGEMAPQLAASPQATAAAERARGNLGQAAEQLQRNNAQEAVQPGREATRHLLEAAQQARESAEAMRRQQEADAARQAVEALAREQRAQRQRTLQMMAEKKAGRPDQEIRREGEQAARAQQNLRNKASALRQDLPPGLSPGIDMATRRMEAAERSLNDPAALDNAQRNQEHAAQVLDRVARALSMEEQSAAHASREGGPQVDPNAEMVQMSGELQMARELQAQVRQETGGIDRLRARNPNGELTGAQQQELYNIAENQNATRQITETAARRVPNRADIAGQLRQAAQEMQQVTTQLYRKETGKPIQERQDQIIQTLDQALESVRKAMQEQRQRSSQPSSRGRQPNRTNQTASEPGKRPPAVVQPEPGAFGRPDMRGRGFGGLGTRALEALREGRQERVPAEYRDLVNQYYRALSERGGR